MPPELEVTTITTPDGARLAVHCAGDGPPLLALHGIPEDHRTFDRVLDCLTARHRVVMPDLRGFGASTDRPLEPPLDLPRMAADLALVVRELRLEAPVLLGHDLGGFVVMHYLQERLGPARGVILFNTTYKKVYLARSPQMPLLGAPLLGPLLIRWLGPRLASSAFRSGFVDPGAADPDQVARCRRMCSRPEIQRTIADVYASIRKTALAKFWTAQPTLQTSDLPALILWGQQDAFLDPRLADWLVHLLPRARLVRLEQAGHFPHQEVPYLVRPALEEFLAGLEG